MVTKYVVEVEVDQLPAKVLAAKINLPPDTELRDSRLKIPVRVLNGLRIGVGIDFKSIRTLADLRRVDDQDILDIRNFGDKTLASLKAALSMYIETQPPPQVDELAARALKLLTERGEQIINALETSARRWEDVAAETDTAQALEDQEPETSGGNISLRPTPAGYRAISSIFREQAATAREIAAELRKLREYTD